MFQTKYVDMRLNTPVRRQLENEYVTFYSNAETLLTLLENIRKYYDNTIIEARDLQLDNLIGTDIDILYGPRLREKRDEFVRHLNELVNFFIYLKNAIEGEFSETASLTTRRRKILIEAMKTRKEKSLILPIDYIRYVLDDEKFKKNTINVLLSHIKIMKACNSMLQKLSPLKYNVDILYGIVGRTKKIYEEQQNALSSDLTTYKNLNSFFSNIISTTEMLTKAVEELGELVQNFMKMRTALFDSMRSYRDEQKLFNPLFTLSTADAFSSLSKRMLTLQKLRNALDTVRSQKGAEIARLSIDKKVKVIDPTLFRIQAPQVDRIEQELDGTQVLIETQLSDSLGHISELQACLKYCKENAEQCVRKLQSVKKKDKKAVKKQLAYLQSLKHVTGDAGKYIKIASALADVFGKFSKKYSDVIKQTVSDMSEIHERNLISEIEKTKEEALDTSKYILGAQSKISPTVYSNIYNQLRGRGKTIMKVVVGPRKKASTIQYKKIKKELKTIERATKMHDKKNVAKQTQVGRGSSGMTFHLGQAVVDMPIVAQEVQVITASPAIPTVFTTEMEYQKDLLKKVSEMLSVLGAKGIAEEVLSASAFKFNEYLTKRIEIERMYNSVITNLFNSKERGGPTKAGTIDGTIKERDVVLRGLDNLCEEDKECVSMKSLYDEFVKRVRTIDAPNDETKKSAIKEILLNIMDSVFQFESIQKFFKCSTVGNADINPRIDLNSSDGGLFGHTIKWNIYQQSIDHIPDQIKLEPWFVFCKDIIMCKSREEIQECPKLISPILDMFTTFLNSEVPCTYTCIYYSLLSIYGGLLINTCRAIEIKKLGLEELLNLFSKLSLLTKFNEYMIIIKQLEKEFIGLFCNYIFEMVNSVITTPHMWTPQQIRTKDHLDPRKFVMHCCDSLYKYYKDKGVDVKNAATRLPRYIDSALNGDVKELFGTVLEFLDQKSEPISGEIFSLIIFFIMSMRIWLPTFLYAIETECVRTQTSISYDNIINGILLSSSAVIINEQEILAVADVVHDKLFAIPRAIYAICSDVLNYKHDVSELVNQFEKKQKYEITSISELLTTIQNIELTNLYTVGTNIVFPAMALKKLMRMTNLMIRGTRQLELEKDATIAYILAVIGHNEKIVRGIVEKVQLTNVQLKKD